MAEKLIEQYGLHALQVRLDTYREQDVVKLALAGQSADPWLDPIICSAEEVGLPKRLRGEESRGRGPQLTVPDRVINELAERLWKANPPPGPSSMWPLWLHLVKPYGYLGIVPWEALLVPKLGVPIVRVPDFIVEPPCESHQTLDVVICASQPVGEKSFGITSQVTDVVRAAVSKVRRRVRLHVFVDGAWEQPVRQALASNGFPEVTARVYPASKAAQYDIPRRTTRFTDASQRVQNPWLQWMLDAMEGQSADVVHFICHGYFANDRGAIALSESPVQNIAPERARFVGPPELTSFLTQMGAWAVCLSSVPGNYSEPGLRALADTIGQLRPGSVLHHEIDEDPHGNALAEAYRFLFNRDPEIPPTSPAVFMYCQPYRVAGVRPAPMFEGDDIWGDSGVVSTDPEYAQIFDQQDRVPNWLAAGQRYIEQAQLQIRKATRTSTRSRTASQTSLKSDDETLRAIRDVMARHARSFKPGSK